MSAIKQPKNTVNLEKCSLKFIRLLRVVFSCEGVITTRSNRMKFRLWKMHIKIKTVKKFLSILYLTSNLYGILSPEESLNWKNQFPWSKTLFPRPYKATRLAYIWIFRHFSFHPSLPLLATTSGQRQFAEPGSDSDEDHVNAMDQDTGMQVDNSLRIWTAAWGLGQRLATVPASPQGFSLFLRETRWGWVWQQ